MPARVSIVYDPDDSCGRLPHNPSEGAPGAAPVMFQKQAEKQIKSMTGKKEFLKTDKSGRTEIQTDRLKETLKAMRKTLPIDTMQDKKFEILRDKCVKEGRLYEDPDFPATKDSIGAVEGLDMNKIEWLRPKEIDPNADFVKNDIDRFDIKQGQLGNCWLLAVISSVTNYRSLLEHVVPMDQPIANNKNYAGIFRFRFWQFGSWKEIIVDDRLPVFKGTKNLVFMHSKDAGECWSPLLEKAYAKLNGSYAKLSGGVQAEAMEDFTGGVCETIDLKNPPADLLEDMYVYSQTSTLMGVSSVSAIIEERTTSGLVKSHAYSITGVDYVTFKGKKQWLVRCRNPWGNATEWKGPFGDNTEEWKSVSDADKKRLKVTFDGDGEFWMSWEDFMKEWSSLEVCHLGGASLSAAADLQGKQKVIESDFAGEWVKNVSAGGCINNANTFSMNPQFRVAIKEQATGKQQKSFMLIGLMQKDMRKLNSKGFNSIGFMVYKVSPNETEILSRDFLRTNKHLAMSKFTFSREVTLKLNLEPGNYVIIPSTFDKDIDCKFILRTITLVPVENEELDVKTKNIGVNAELKAQMEKLDQASVKDMLSNFEKVQTADKTITVKGLVKILNGSSLKTVKNFQGINVEIGRSLLAAIDNDISGELTWDEYHELWRDCLIWKLIFERVDSDKNGFMEGCEMREALKLAGFTISNHAFEAIMMRYSEPDSGHIDFDDYLMCLSRLKNSIENMSYQHQTTTGHRIFTEDDYMRYAIYT